MATTKENKLTLSAFELALCCADRTHAPVWSRMISPVDAGLYIVRGSKVRAHDRVLARRSGIKVARSVFA